MKTKTIPLTILLAVVIAVPIFAEAAHDIIKFAAIVNDAGTEGKRLGELDGYLVYYTAVPEYTVQYGPGGLHAYYMLREPAQTKKEMREQMRAFFEDYNVIEALRNDYPLTSDYLYGDESEQRSPYRDIYSIYVHFVKPSDELEYAQFGENSFDYMNNQTTPLARHTLATVTVSPDDVSYDDCKAAFSRGWNGDRWDEESRREKLP